MTDWAKHMSEVSDEVIEPFIQNWEQYPSAIVQAAVGEMAKRGKPVDPQLIKKMHENFAQRTDLEWNAAHIKSGTEDNFSDPQQTNDTNAPVLYSRRAIMSFSVLMCPLFASFLLASNIDRTEQKRGFWLVILCGVVHIGIVYGINSELKATFAPLVYLLNAAGGYVLSQPLWNEFIGKHVQYRKRTLVYPILATVALIAVLILLLVINS